MNVAVGMMGGGFAPRAETVEGGVRVRGSQQVGQGAARAAGLAAGSFLCCLWSSVFSLRLLLLFVFLFRLHLRLRPGLGLGLGLGLGFRLRLRLHLCLGLGLGLGLGLRLRLCFLFGSLRFLFFVFLFCSTSLPGGNQVDGLPPA